MIFSKKDKDNQRDDRAYYEVFADTVVMLNTFKLVTLVLCGIIFFQVFVNLKAQNKVPVVISVDHLGKARSTEVLKLAGEPDEIQIKAFVKEFIETYTSYDSKSIEYDFSEALNLMHSDYQRKAQRELVGSNLLNDLKEQSLYAKVTIQEIRVEKNVPGWVDVWVAGVRTIHSYLDSEFSKETVFNAYVTLAKVSRTEKEPYGLLAYDYREHLMKNNSI